MPADLAAVVVAFAYVFAGGGVLAGIGMTPSGTRMVAALGLAYVAGLAATVLVMIALACAGVPVSLVTFAVVTVVVGGSGIGVWFWRGGRPGRLTLRGLRPASRLKDVGGWTTQRWLVTVVGAILLVFAALVYRWARVMPVIHWDGWSIWARKGTILYDYGTPPMSFFGAYSYARFMHPDYPLLVPAFESIWFHLIAAPDIRSLHVEFWLLFVASLAAAAYLVAPVSRPAVWLPVIGFIAVIPAVVGQLMTLYADVPMALLLLLGVLSLGLWIDRQRDGVQRGSLLALATLFLAAAASTKNEGLTAAVAVLAVALIVTLVKPVAGRRARDARSLLIAAFAFAVVIAPWRLWLLFHHISGDMPVGKGLSPSYLASRAYRISPALTGLYDQTLRRTWYFLLPLALGVVLACFIVRIARRPAAFYGLAGLAVGAALMWGYVINPIPISGLVASSADRTIDGVMFVAIAAVLHLTGRLLPSRAVLRQRVLEVAGWLTRAYQT
jgi:hypothetical protein